MNLFGLKIGNDKTKDDLSKLLKVDKQILSKFEEYYNKNVLTDVSDNFFELNSKQAAELKEGVCINEEYPLDDITNRIIEELIENTISWSFDGKSILTKDKTPSKIIPVTNEEICKLPKEIRPQLTGSLAKIDIAEPSYIALLSNYQMYQKEKNHKKKQQLYGLFRQGLDILDIDPITYEMIGMNQNSMGYWLPKIVDSISIQNFFKIPKTTIIKLPIPLLQLTKLDYMDLTRTTLDIVDNYCYKVFNLDEQKSYFIKTGTYSSKFDFRNAKVIGTKEIKELGEYLLFIHHQACQMASPLNNPCIYGVSTTNEWVVREFIEDKENNPCIYKGLPLHTEYRIFVDFDTKKIIGVNPYWDSETMKSRFGDSEDSDSSNMIHDYIIYTAHEETLMNRYYDNIDTIVKHIEDFIQDVEGLNGQWSIDIMQNGNDFWFIDMALAYNSALNHCIPEGLLKPIEENWIPKLN